MRTPEKRIGLLIPSPNVAAEPEFARHLPAGFTVHAARMYWTRGGEEEMLDRYLPDAVRDLASLHPDIVVFACTTAGAIRGNRYENELIRSVERDTGAPVISVMAESIAALQALGARRVGVLTPYPDEDNVHIAAALTESGLEVTVIAGLRIPGVSSSELSTDDLIPFGKRTLEGVDYDAVFIACTNVFTIASIPEYESAFGKPVVTTLSAAVDAVERELGDVSLRNR